MESIEAVINLTAEGRVVAWNDGAEHLYGYSGAEMVGRLLEEIVPDRLVTDHNRVVQQTVAQRRSHTFRSVHRGRDGEEVPARVTLSPLFDAEGALASLVAVERRLDQAPRDRELLEHIVETIPVMLVIWDPTLQRFDLNRHARRILGYDEQDAASPDFMNRVYPDVNYRSRVSRFMQELDGSWHEWTAVTKDGREVPTDWTNVRLTDERMLGIGVDLRERRRAERALAESEAKLHRLFRDAPCLIAVFEGPAHRHLFANRRYEAASGHRRLIGRSLREAVPEVVELGIPEQLDHVYRTGEALHTPELGVRRRSREGRGDERKWFEQILQPWYDDAGEVAGVMAFAFDVTEQVHLRGLLEEANDRLERRVEERTARIRHQTRELRALAREVTLAEQAERERMAHALHEDLQQILVAARMALHPLETRQEPPVQDAAERATMLIERAIDAARNLAGELQPPMLYEQGLVEALEWLARHFEELHGMTIGVDVAPGAGERLSKTLQTLLFTTSRELLVNVAQHARSELAWVSLRSTNEGVRLEVTDKGVGCDRDEALASEGFGLGTLRRRIEVLGGSFDLHVDEGCRVCVDLPVTEND